MALSIAARIALAALGGASSETAHNPGDLFEIQPELLEGLSATGRSQPVTLPDLRLLL